MVGRWRQFLQELRENIQESMQLCPHQAGSPGLCFFNLFLYLAVKCGFPAKLMRYLRNSIKTRCWASLGASPEPAGRGTASAMSVQCCGERLIRCEPGLA